METNGGHQIMRNPTRSPPSSAAAILLCVGPKAAPHYVVTCGFQRGAALASAVTHWFPHVRLIQNLSVDSMPISADPLGSAGVWYRPLSSFFPSCCPPPWPFQARCHPPAPRGISVSDHLWDLLKIRCFSKSPKIPQKTEPGTQLH